MNEKKKQTIKFLIHETNNELRPKWKTKENKNKTTSTDNYTHIV